MDAVLFNESSTGIQSVKDLPFAFRVTMATVTIIFTLLILFCNTLVIIVVARSRDFRNATGYFFISLAVADLGMGFIIPLYTYSMLYGEWPYGDVVCHIAAWFRGGLVCISIWHLFFLSLDTFLAVYKPLKHKQLLTFNKCMVFIAISWVTGLALFTLPIFGFGEYKYLEYNGYCLYDSLKSAKFTYVAAAYLFPALTAIYVLNGWIWCMVSRRARRGTMRNQPGNSEHPSTLHRTNCQYTARQIRNWKAAKTIFLILAFFTLTTMVMYILHLIQSMARIRLPMYVAIIGGYMGLANHWINIFVYTYMIKRIRIGVRRILCCCCNSAKAFEEHNRDTNGKSATGRSGDVWDRGMQGSRADSCSSLSGRIQSSGLSSPRMSRCDSSVRIWTSASRTNLREGEELNADTRL